MLCVLLYLSAPPYLPHNALNAEVGNVLGKVTHV